MSLLLIAPVAPDLPVPDFGGAFAGHIARKAHPGVRAASLSAWSLLARGLRELGLSALPAVEFGPQGKPCFADADLHFSLSHSGALAAALISPAPCGVDVEAVRPETALHLAGRCLNPEERALNPDFFECWTKKECIGKLSGAGLPAHPAGVDTLDPRYRSRFFTQHLRDPQGREYVLSALCADAAALRVMDLVSSIE